MTVAPRSTAAVPCNKHSLKSSLPCHYGTCHIHTTRCIHPRQRFCLKLSVALNTLCLFVYLYICLSVRPSVRLSVCPSVRSLCCWSVSPSVLLSVRLSVRHFLSFLIPLFIPSFLVLFHFSSFLPLSHPPSLSLPPSGVLPSLTSISPPPLPPFLCSMSFISRFKIQKTLLSI